MAVAVRTGQCVEIYIWDLLTYMGWLDYDDKRDVSAEPVVINVLIAITEAGIEDYGGSRAAPGRAATMAAELASDAYKNNDLPIQVTRAQDVVLIPPTYKDTEKFKTNLENLVSQKRPFAGIDKIIEREEADLTILLVGDYEDPKDEENKDLKNTCGLAHEFFVNDKDDAFAIVQSPCIAAHSVTNVIGYMQGAGYNPEQKRNTEFAYGHGYYDVDGDVRKRTVMSQDYGNCNHPITPEDEYCERIAMWSDPHREFFGSQRPTGTVEHWNARVVFSTAPHIASFMGDTQDYDSVRPTGSIELPSTMPTSGAMKIDATFSEPIHEWFPPYITITDGALKETTAAMTRVSSISYTYQHMLDGESGRFDLVFSNARDMLGNPVVKTPTSGASFVANAQDAPPQPAPPPGSIISFEDEFSRDLTHNWIPTGDADWTKTRPFKSAPDEDAEMNMVAASDSCDDSCILTLRKTLDTTEPLVVSFDRYIDGDVNNREGLFLEYSVDNGGTWNSFASYTGRGGYDTSRWERSVAGLSIPENSAMFRLHATSNIEGEHIEVDNLHIFRPDTPVPDVTFESTLGSMRDTVSLVFSRPVPASFSASDFSISPGTIDSIQDTNSRTVKTLHLSGQIPHDTPVTVTYVGSDRDFGGGAVLNTGTSSVAPAIPSPDKAPVIQSIPDIEVVQGGSATISVSASDPDGTTPVLSLTERPGFVTLERHGGGTGTITAAPTRATVAGPYAVEVTATSNSLSDTESFVVRVTPAPPQRDTTPPSITPPSDRTFEATGVTTSITPAQLGAVTVRDNADPNPSVSHDSPGSFRLGTHVITWTATDSSGNSASAVQRITVRDTTIPDITLVGDRTIRIEVGSTYEERSAVCTDNIDGPLPVVQQGTVYTDTIGRYHITYSCTDDSGNPASVSRTVTVRRAQDTTPPAITPPRGLIFEARGVNTTLNPFSLGTATVIDDTDPHPAVSNDFPGALGLGTHKITWTATDSSGNSASAIQWITIRDSVAPDIALVGDRTVRIVQGSTYEELSATCTDNINGPLPVVRQGSADTRIDATYRITYSCSDASGNDASVTRTVRVAPPSGTVHTVTPADFEYDINGLHHSCPEVVCLGFERIRTTDPQFVRFVISSGTVSDGDTVVFRDGTYDLVGPIVIRQSNLTIRSDDGSGVTIRSTDNKGMVFRNSGDVSGLEIRWLDVMSSDTTRLAPARNFGMIFMENTPGNTEGYSDITIRNNTFHGDKQHAIRIGSVEPYNEQNKFSDVSILHNTFHNIPADRKDIHITHIDGVTISGNTFSSDDYIRHESVGRLDTSGNRTPGNTTANLPATTGR